MGRAPEPLPGESFGDNLRIARERHDLSQEQLGVYAGLSATTVYRLEVGEREPRLATVMTLARALDMSVADLIHGLE
jgi:transcriptional regulator with XRE-family HTH domain